MQNKGLVKMRVIGITGGVGAGKSMVLTFLINEYGAEVIQADEVAHDLMEPGKPGYRYVTKALGEGILHPDGTIDRKILGKKIFEDQNTREIVDNIIHPMVWERIKQKILASQARLIVVEFAIMNDTRDDIYDEVWYLHASKENRIKRLAKSRGYTRERSERMIKSQASEAEFIARCDRVIENNGSFEELKEQLMEILKSKGQEKI